mmetsp:Transcript_43034/g.133919  ORF Transcript_43034/g.133919 Transcript_43034/m.133919 type:complete len:258 (-) Transcript_43034:441-1214(-)
MVPTRMASGASRCSVNSSLTSEAAPFSIPTLKVPRWLPSAATECSENSAFGSEGSRFVIPVPAWMPTAASHCSMTSPLVSETSPSNFPRQEPGTNSRTRISSSNRTTRCAAAEVSWCRRTSVKASRTCWSPRVTAMLLRSSSAGGSRETPAGVGVTSSAGAASSSCWAARAEVTSAAEAVIVSATPARKAPDAPGSTCPSSPSARASSGTLLSFLTSYSKASPLPYSIVPTPRGGTSGSSGGGAGDGQVPQSKSSSE